MNSLRSWGWLIFFVAGLGRLVYVVKVDPPEARLFKFEVTSVARAFAARGELSDPYKDPTGPTAHLVPVFPIFAGLVLRCTGEAMWGWVLKPIAALVSAASWALMPWLALRLGLPLAAGVLAGLWGGLAPFQLYVETNGVWETPYAVLAMILLMAATARLWDRDERRFGRWLLLGLMWGASILLSAAHLPVFAGVLVLPSIWFVRSRGFGWMKFPVVCLAGALLMLMPWTIRNYFALGGWVPLRSNGGLELALSFRDGVGAMVDFKTQRSHPANSTPESAKVREMGEIAYNRMRGAEGKEWMWAHSGEVVSLTLRRAATFWFMPYPGWIKQAALWMITILGFAGLITAIGRHRNAVLLMGSLLATYPLVYYLHVLDPRYVYPVYWPLVLMGSNLVCRLRLKPAE